MFYNGITFIDEDGNSVHTYDDYGFILKDAMPSFPTAKTHYLEIPERDGELDLTNALSEETYFNMRSMNITIVDLDDFHHFSGLFSQFLNFVAGKRLKIILDKDKAYYYYGRVEVDEYSDLNKTYASQVSFVCTLEPFKYAVDSTSDRWRWDPFNFRTGKIENTSGLVVNGTMEMEIDAGARNVVPTITCSSSMSLQVNAERYSLQRGENNNVVFKAGKNTLVFTGNGTVTIDLIRKAF